MIAEKLKLKDVCVKITKGTTPSTYGFPFVESGINYVKAESILESGGILPNTFAFIDEATHEYLKRSILCDKDILISIAGAKLGKCGFLTEQYLPANTNQAVGIVRVDQNTTDPKFVYYNFVSSHTYQVINSLNSQAAQPNLNLGQLGELEFKFPPLPTQRKIASILTAYDDLIENNLKRIKLLEEKAQLHYTELMQGSALWDKVKLEEFVSVVKGRKPANVLEQPEEECQLYLLLDTVERGKTLYTNDLSLPQSKITDVLMCMDGARSGLSFRSMVGAIGSTMAIWRSNSESVSGEFLYQFMKQNESAITQGNTGAAIPHANRKFILDMKIAMPPIKEAEYFDSSTLPMIKLINTLHNQNTKLREARDILLPKLMNGQSEV